MRISKENNKKIRKWFDDKSVTKPCASCGESTFTVVDQFVFSPVFKVDDGLLISGIGGYPQAMVVCNNCGDTRYFNISVMGIKDLLKSKSQPSKNEKLI